MCMCGLCSSGWAFLRKPRVKCMCNNEIATELETINPIAIPCHSITIAPILSRTPLLHLNRRAGFTCRRNNPLYL